MSGSKSQLESQDSAASERLDSWKEIAAYLGRDVRTVRRWEKAEALPVHRHFHNEAATVFAYETELDGWLKGREVRKQSGELTNTPTANTRRPVAYVLAIAGAAVLIAIAYLFAMGPGGFGSDKSTAGATTNSTSEDTNHDPKYSVIFAEAPGSFSTRQPSFDISPSGDRGVFYVDKDGEPGQLYLYAQFGAVIRPLLNDLGPWQGFQFPNWSSSEHLIAYVATKPAEPRANAVEGERNQVSAIFVVSPDGGTPRQIGPAMRQINGLCWTPDGKGLTYLDADRDGAHTVSLDGSGVKTIPMDHSAAVLGGYSPDGRWLAMRVRTDLHLLGMHSQIQLLSTTDDQVVPLTKVSGFHITFTWAPDGKSLYFSKLGGQVRKLNIDPETGALQGDPEQVTFYSGAYAMYPKFINGGRIVFALSSTTWSIHVADASSPTESKSVAAGYFAKLSPDGQIIYHFGRYGSSTGGLYAVPKDGGTPTLVPNISNRYFDLSPDGETFAYIKNRDGETSLFTASTHGGEPRLLHEFKGNTDSTRWARWSPDGSLLAYAHGTGLYVIPSDGGTPKKLADMPSWRESSLRWSPDGESIAAFGFPDGYGDGNAISVFVVPVSGGEPRQILSSSVWLESLEWHPDGQRLTYNDSTDDNGTWQVFLDGRPPSLLVNEPNHWDFHGRWSPDGRYYYFQSPFIDKDSSKEQSGIAVFDEETGEISHIANMGTLPTWSRDGKTMTWANPKSTNQIIAMSDFH